MKTHTIASFINHLGGMAERMLLAEHKALKEAAKVVEKEAKAEIGTYQKSIGTFAKWEQLAESTKGDRVAQGYSENDPLLRSGKLRDSISNEVRGLSAAIGSTSDVMVYQELGTSRIPPRAVLGPALLRKEKQVLALVGNYTAHAMLEGSPFSHMPTIPRED